MKVNDVFVLFSETYQHNAGELWHFLTRPSRYGCSRTNVGLLFVVFDGKSRRIRVNGKASVPTDQEALDRHFGAKMVIRIECKIYPNCTLYIPNLADARESPHVPRSGQGTPPPPEWKTREYIRTELPDGDPPHRYERDVEAKQKPK